MASTDFWFKQGDGYDSEQMLLKKILNALLGVVTGAGGFLVRGTVSTTPAATTTAMTAASGTKTVAASGTPEKLVATTTLAESVIIVPLRTNTGAAYVGFTSTDDAQSILAPCVVTAPTGKKVDLSAIYIDVGTNGEGVSYTTVD